MKQKPTDYRNRIKALEYVNSADLTAHPGNWREHPAAQAEALKGVLSEVGIAGALLAYRSERQGGALVVIDGHLRKDAAPQKWPVLILDVDDAEADYLLATHDPLAAMATADAGALDALLSSVQSGEAAVQQMLAELAEGAGLYPATEGDEPLDGLDEAVARSTLAERFIVPPFSVLDARQGYWQNRKRAWISLGIESELGRGVNLGDVSATVAGISDPEAVAMRGEHVVGERRLTWVAGDRPRDELDDTSRKILAAGRKPGPRTKLNDATRDTSNPTSIHNIPGYYWKKQRGETDEEIWDNYIANGGGVNVSGTSIFDPVLCELAYTWFTAPGAHVLDPFAGGSVRGIVAAYLGRRYTGIDLRPEQIEANEAQARAILSGDRREEYTRDPNAPTPVQRRGELWFKRDDLFEVGGVYGGKVRTCYALAQGAAGLVTAGSRQSPQANIVAQIARVMGIPCRVHTPTGELSPELLAARAAGAEVVQHKAGYNNVIIARAREDAAALGWTNIPFGMECGEAIQATRAQAGNLPAEAQRLVIPVGSGMSLAGVLWGLRDAGLSIPVLGVVVGADPVKRLDTYAPPDWRDMVTLVPSGLDYHAHAEQDVIEGVALDPVYEAKCVPFLQPGDCLWIVGIRQTAKPSGERGKKDAPFPRWIVGNSLNVIPDEAFDFIFTCPPYYDLEVYSDDPEDLSNKDTYEGFLVDYRAIIAQAVARLRDDRFACVVVGDVRDKKGMYRNFVADTIAAFRDTGMGLYNEAILVTAVGSLSIRVGKQFSSGRKLGKTHQNVLVFVKGDPRTATAWCGPVEVGLLEGADEVGA